MTKTVNEQGTKEVLLIKIIKTHYFLVRLEKVIKI